MKITWQGHACFYIESADGLRIVTDPYTPAIAGLPPLQTPADVVLMSSDNDLFHSDGKSVQGNPVVVNTLAVAREGGRREVKGITVQAIEAMESLIHKTHPDQNALYRFEVDGVNVGHMGDVGNPLSPAQMDFFKGVDVLLVLTGGPPTIELDDLDAVLKEVQPRLVIPMHYRIPNLNLNILGIEAFTSRFAPAMIDTRNSTSIEFTSQTLPASMQIVVLNAVANQRPHTPPPTPPQRGGETASHA
jgi:L-ascorbate metabolism protein UlaG (beta-lactamase superfamily)